MTLQAHNPTYEKVYGGKYQANLGVKEIAKLIRTDIKKAVVAGTLPHLKCSVRISRFAGGQSITVCVKEASFQIVNPEFVKVMKEDPHSYDAWHRVGRYTEEASAVLEDLKALVESYNYDGSDLMTDYFNVNFYNSVGFGHYLEQEQTADIEALLEPTPEPAPTPEVPFLTLVPAPTEPELPTALECLYHFLPELAA